MHIEVSIITEENNSNSKNAATLEIFLEGERFP